MDDEFTIKDEQRERVNDMAKCLFGCTLDEMREKLEQSRSKRPKVSGKYKTVCTGAMFLANAESISHIMSTLMDADITDLASDEAFEHFRLMSRKFMAALSAIADEVSDNLPSLDIWGQKEEAEKKEEEDKDE